MAMVQVTSTASSHLGRVMAVEDDEMQRVQTQFTITASL
jgi:hypothetical protein